MMLASRVLAGLAPMDVGGLIFDAYVRLSARTLLDSVRNGFRIWADFFPYDAENPTSYIDAAKLLCDSLPLVHANHLYPILFAAVDGFIVPDKFYEDDCQRKFNIVMRSGEIHIDKHLIIKRAYVMDTFRIKIIGDKYDVRSLN